MKAFLRWLFLGKNPKPVGLSATAQSMKNSIGLVYTVKRVEELANQKHPFWGGNND